MFGSARAGLFLYAKDSDRLSKFYQSVARMSTIHKTEDLTVLQSSDIQLLIHKIPSQIARDIDITSPPQKRENTALKFFFTVPNLDSARACARDLGGEVFNENWSGPGFVLCNAMDPEGNVFQIRESMA